MNDQLALGVLWREVGRRSERNNRGTGAGDAIANVAGAIAEDVATFEAIMRRLQIRRNRVKTSSVRAVEWLSRMKPNGGFRSYSALDRFEELDFLAFGIEGKKVLWMTLRDHAALGERLPDIDFDHLIERAQRQREAIEPHRTAAGREAFAPR